MATQFNTMKTTVRVDGLGSVVGEARTGCGKASSSFSSGESCINAGSFDIMLESRKGIENEE